MSGDTPSKFPRLELYFDAKSGMLKHSDFREKAASMGDDTFCRDTSGSLFVSELCILILLAKYRGDDLLKPDKPIRFRNELGESSWLKALGVSFNKDTHKGFFQECFGEVDFVMASRGSGHNKARKKSDQELHSFAEFRPAKLRLANVFICKHIYKIVPGGKTRKLVEFSRSELPKLARQIESAVIAGMSEKGGTHTKHKWKPTVDWMVADIDKKSPNLPQPAPAQDSDPVPFKIADLGNDFLLDINKQIASRREPGNWYVLSSVPDYLGSWKKNFCNAILQRGSSVNFIHAMPVDPDFRVAKLWQGSPADQSGEKPSETLDKRLSEALQEMTKWVAELKSDLGQRKDIGEFKYSHTNVSIPYIAILFDPARKEKPESFSDKAPEGAWCALSLHSIHPVHFGEQFGLYLDKPSPMLDAYYRSIMRFFKEAPKDPLYRLLNIGNEGDLHNNNGLQ